MILDTSNLTDINMLRVALNRLVINGVTVWQKGASSYSNFITSKNNNLVTSDGLVFKVVSAPVEPVKLVTSNAQDFITNDNKNFFAQGE